MSKAGQILTRIGETEQVLIRMRETGRQILIRMNKTGPLLISLFFLDNRERNHKTSHALTLQISSDELIIDKLF